MEIFNVKLRVSDRQALELIKRERCLDSLSQALRILLREAEKETKNMSTVVTERGRK